MRGCLGMRGGIGCGLGWLRIEVVWALDGGIRRLLRGWRQRYWLTADAQRISDS